MAMITVVTVVIAGCGNQQYASSKEMRMTHTQVESRRKLWSPTCFYQLLLNMAEMSTVVVCRTILTKASAIATSNGDYLLPLLVLFFGVAIRGWFVETTDQWTACTLLSFIAYSHKLTV